MEGLRYLSDNMKDLIRRIADKYQIDRWTLKNEYEGIIQILGLHFSDVLSDDDSNISFFATEDKIGITIESGKFQWDKLNNSDEKESYAANQSAIIHADCIEQLYFLKWLSDNNLVYFTREHNDFKDIPKEIGHSPQGIFRNWIISSDILKEFIITHYKSRIIPSLYLISFAKEFKTPEQIEYEEQLKISKKALKRAKLGNWIAISIGVISILISVILAKYVPVDINDQQHKELIEAIKYIGKTENEKP